MKTILITGLCVSVFANLLFIIYIFLSCRKIYIEDKAKEKPVKESFKYSGDGKFYRPIK